MAWLVRGCLEWQNFGLHPPSKVLAATAAYREDSDPLAAFIDASCELADGLSATSRALYDAYAAFAEQRQLLLPVTTTIFTGL